MEERMAGGSNSNKDKKYVLYTVVGDDRNRTTPASWMIKILLGSLMVVALAVVPYISLRIAQANSRTLVVFQPVPVHNRTSGHHSSIKHDSTTSRRKPNLMQVADLTLENYTVNAKVNETAKRNIAFHRKGGKEGELNGTVGVTEAPLTSLEVTSNNNSIMVTLQESDVAIAVLEQKNSSSADVKVNSTKVDSTGYESSIDSSTETKHQSTQQMSDVMVSTSSVKQTPQPELKPTAATPLSSSSGVAANSVATATKSTSSSRPTEVTSKPVQKSSSSFHPALLHKNIASTAAAEKMATKETTALPQPKSLSHKLVYVATSASGNHVGGICVWKVDKNVTNWSYFYDNIPIEYQSGHDSGDHELRTTLAAVRTWSSLWQDAHVTLRSQHNAIEHSDLGVRKILVEELEKTSDGHFTYELEWRLPEADTLVKLSNSLSRLHQDYKFWFQDFKTHVDGLLGQQNWDKVVKERHAKVDEDSFFTDESIATSDEAPEQVHPNKSLSETAKVSSTAKPGVSAPRPLSHKLVYVATSASGNHVGGFCIWKLDKNVTDWSYFYDNIPVEYQSNHDSADHEQRATLAAVRVWATRWQDAHVTLRSQHAAIERSDGHLKKILVENLDKLSEGHFTYDLEWRLRKSDDLVKISFSLSRLHRNFGHWYAVFKASVDEILGPQNWGHDTKSRRVTLTDQHFYTEEPQPEINENSLQSTLAELQN